MATRADLLNMIAGITELVNVRDDAPPVEIACVNGIPQTDPNATYNFQRKLHHQDWVDGESLVQAGKTPDEAGFNERFHNIEKDLDSLGDNVKRAFQAVSALRAQLRVCLNEIVIALAAADKNDAKDSKDAKDTPDAKSEKDNKDTKDSKDTPDGKEAKDDKDTKEDKESKDIDDKNPKESHKDTLGAAEKKDLDHIPAPPPSYDGIIGAPPASTGAALPGGMSFFIAPEERPTIGERALNAPRTE
jgi:hypothetical protein